METARSEAPEADLTARIGEIEREIRLLNTLRYQARLEADARCQLARIAASQSDMRAADSCRRITARGANEAWPRVQGKFPDSV